MSAERDRAVALPLLVGDLRRSPLVDVIAEWEVVSDLHLSLFELVMY